MPTKTWTGLNATDANWSRSDNWSPSGAPAAGDDLHFAGSTRPSTNNDIAIDTSFASITFDSGAASFTLAGNEITLAGQITQNSTNPHTISLNIVATAQRNVDFANTGGITISGIISGSGGGIETTGTGVLTLSGTNTFTGYAWAVEGTISVNAIADKGTACPLGAGADDYNGSIYLGDDVRTGTLLYTGSGHTTNRRISLYGITGGGIVDQSGTGLLKFTTATIGEIDGNKTLTLQGSTAGTGEFSAAIPNPDTGVISIVKSGTGLWAFSATNTYTGTTTVSGGTLQIGSGGTTGAISTSSAITVTSPGVLAFNRSNAVTQGTSFASVIGGTGSVSQLGTSSLTFNGNNTFAGGVTIAGTNGTVTAASNNNALGSGTVTFNGGRRLVVSDGLTITNNIVIGTNSGLAGRGMIENSSSGNATVNGTITINNAASSGGHFAGASTGSLTLTGAITSSVQVTCRIGIVVFSGGGSYTSLAISQGTGRLGANNGIATTSDVVMGSNGNANFDLAGYDQSLNKINRNGNTVQVGNSSTVSNSTLTLTGTSSYTGVIIDVLDSGNKKVNLVVNSSGTVTLSGANTYTGTTTVTAGILLVNGSISGTGAVTVSNTATLGGTGTIAGAITQSSGSFINPGNGGTNIGTLGTADVTMNASSTCQVNLDGVTPTADKINSSGTVTCAGTLTISSATNPARKTYSIITASTVSGTFAGLSNGTIFKAFSRFYKITYTGTTVTLTDVSNWFLLHLKNCLYGLQNINR